MIWLLRESGVLVLMILLVLVLVLAVLLALAVVYKAISLTRRIYDAIVLAYHSERLNSEVGKPPLSTFLELFLGWKAPSETSVLNHPCAKDSQNLLMLVSKNTSLSPLQFGRSLNVSENEIFNIRCDYSDLTEQVYEVSSSVAEFVVFPTARH